MFWFLVFLTINFQFLIAISNVLCPVEQLRIPPQSITHLRGVDRFLFSEKAFLTLVTHVFDMFFPTHDGCQGSNSWQCLRIGLNLKRLSCPCFLPVGYSLSLRLSYPHNFQLWSFCWRWAALVSEQLTSLYSNDNMWNQHIL